VLIRPAEPADAAAVAAVYGHHVLHGLGTFEETPPSAEEMARRMAAVAATGLPWLLAEEGGRALGYAYAAPFRPRAAYRYTAEDSVYVAPDAQGRGVGRALLQAIVAACEARGLRRLTALIGDTGNTASIALHAACGFERAGLLPAVGFKHERWVDAVWMQRALGDPAAPLGPGLTLEG